MIVVLLFFGVLLGMQYANEGMKKTKGYDDPGLYQAFTVSESNAGELETSILGEKITSHDIEKKKEQLEEMKAFNFFSSLGKNLAGVISGTMQKMIQLFFD
jgi:hypothetical protein